MEVEITNLFDGLNYLDEHLEMYKNRIFYEGMRGEFEKMVQLGDEIEQKYNAMENQRMTTYGNLEKITTEMIETCWLMKTQISHDTTEVPFNEIKFNNISFLEKIEILFQLNNYMLALREVNSVVLAKYFPMWYFFNNKINEILTKSCEKNAKSEIWKMCIQLRLSIFNFTESLSNVCIQSL